MFIQFIINGLVTGLIYALTSLAFALVYNTTRIFHIAFAALYVIASYLFYTFSNQFGLPIYLSVFLAILFNTLFSILIEIFIYKPLEVKKTSNNLILISSIGTFIILINCVALIYGNDTKVINNNISSSVQLGEILITNNQIYQAVFSLFAIIILFALLKYSKLGLQTRAIRDDSELSRIFGIDIFRVRYVLFGLSGALVAIASCLNSYDVGMDPYIGMPILLNAMVALIIGGIGRFEAPLIGGIILGVLQAIAIYYFESRWENAITFGILLLFLIFRPQGILGEKSREV
ncbi:branched-chain amino acid ABC transporter permease [Arcicella sp. LKC2W]|uniref:branched-chain amino acid ABC transporter permease n=1 Tax=Arcicella sp. LKC2W TaxID=2984198 RepID=UPI002B1F7F32|nr:branched-chain amino acid ABC transporter permease [Arcicella sp. LKC2W]MEA5461663.1 branched-chain amino acid ABC transporter permease [Arcicella sp. LKC2W]